MGVESFSEALKVEGIESCGLGFGSKQSEAREVYLITPHPDPLPQVEREFATCGGFGFRSIFDTTVAQGAASIRSKGKLSALSFGIRV